MAEKLDPYELLQRVVDRESFLAFARALMLDYRDEVEKEKASPSKPYSPGPNGWENGPIDMYLEAAIDWTEDWIGRERELPQEPSWRSFAEFLYAGKYYE
jgi:hypothetical protein